MNSPAPVPPPDPLATDRTHLASLRSHLANERTHLAYLRTTISLLGFGIALNRFSLYLRQTEVLSPRQILLLRDTSYIGIGMVLIGLFLLVWSLYRFWVVSKDIERDRFVPRYKTMMAVSLGLLLLGGISALLLFLY